MKGVCRTCGGSNWRRGRETGEAVRVGEEAHPLVDSPQAPCGQGWGGVHHWG